MLRRILRWILRERSSEQADQASEDFPGGDVLRSRRDPTDLPSLGLSEYRDLCSELTPPTDVQVDDFADHVSKAKSWYKHLPLLPPGAPFFFFVDPFAGYDRILESDDRVTLLPRQDETAGVHYSLVKTDEYHKRFDHLSFSCEFGSELFFPVSVMRDGQATVEGLLDNNPSSPVIHLSDNRSFRLPQELLDAGAVYLTAVIHELAASVGLWYRVVQQNQEDPGWPEQSGGAATWEAIRERWESSGEQLQRIVGIQDEELARLLEPERSRLLGEMSAAMKRIRALIYG